MAWITLTTTDLTGILSAAEVTALRALRPTAESADPVAEVLTHAIREVRGYVQAASRRVAAGLTIPEELQSATLVLARHKLIGKLPDSRLLSDGRRKEFEDAQALLKMVAEGKFGFEETSSAASTTKAPATTKVIRRHTGFDRANVPL